MEGSYPIIIKGENCGELIIAKEGAYTRFVAKCAFVGEVIRLCVYGEGKEGYLGVPVPKEGMLILEKRFSPAALKDFPKHIEGCTLSGETILQNKSEKEEAQDCAEEIKAEVEDAEEEQHRFWYATSDGALVSRDGEIEMVALPPDDERVPKNFPGQPKVIEGKEYLVYITKESAGSND